MLSEKLLTGAAKARTPRAGAKADIRANVLQRIRTESPLFAELSRAVTPKKSVQTALWKRISPRITSPYGETLKAARDSLYPTQRFAKQLRAHLLRLQPVRVTSRTSQVLKWTAAFAFVAILVRVSPMLFIASSTVAESEVMLLPTRGEVSVFIGGLWQTVDGDIPLEAGMKIRTHDGEASIILYDKAVFRLDPLTTVELNDVSDRLEPQASELFPTVTLLTGRMWVHGLVPQQLRGVTVATMYGHVTVNEGSVSLAEKDSVEVEVYDRSATILKNGQPTYLAAGERTELSEGNVLLVKKIPVLWYQEAWADQNLKRDAVHRHDIAQRQHEMRIAKAGILPTSSWYPAKRFAEYMDEKMTFGEDSRVQKRLQFAETRLNEAAALIYEGQDAQPILDEYKLALEHIVNGTNSDSLAEFLVERAIAESTAQTTAALPGDESYAIKKTVLETSASIQSPVVNQRDRAQGALLLDGLAVMLRAVDEGNTNMVRSVWSDLQPYLVVIEDEKVTQDPSLYKEAHTLLSFLATSLTAAHDRGADVDPELLDDLVAYLPPPIEPGPVTLSDDDILQIVQGIKENIFLYNMTQSRVNQFVAELRAVEGNPDAGRILRRLAQELPDGPEQFPDRIYKEIVKLRWERAGGEVI